MGVIELNGNIFTGKSNVSPPCLDLGDGTSILLTSNISEVEPKGTNIEFKKGTTTYFLTNNRMPTTIKEFFPDPIVATHIAQMLNKVVESKVTITDLDKITYFGANKIEATTSYFSGKSVSTFEGTQYLRKIKTFSIIGYYGAKEIDISGATELTSLAYSFKDTPIEKVFLPETMPYLTSMYSAFQKTKLIEIRMPKRADALTNLRFAFASTPISEIILPEFLGNLVYIDGFAGCSNLVRVTLPAKLNKVTASVSSSTLDSNSKRTIVYHSDNSIYHKNQIKYHDEYGVPMYTIAKTDYTNLSNV